MIRKYILLSEEEIEKHHLLKCEAWNLLRPLMLVDGGVGQGKPSPQECYRLHQAIAILEQAIEISADGSSLYALGKAHQRLGEDDTAFFWFRLAHNALPENSEIAREAGLTALNLGNAFTGIKYCALAVELNPDDPGLLSNLALAYLLAGEDKEAFRTVDGAVKRDPSDQISQAALLLVDEVLQGKRQRPVSLRDLG